MSWDLNELFKSHARNITRSLKRRGLSEDIAEELTQDTFVRVLASPPSASAANYNPIAYLYRISRNLSIDHLRRERLFFRVEFSDEDFAAVTDPSPSPETVVYNREKLALTQAALAELPKRTQQAFQLHRLGELTIAETGVRLGLSTSRTWALIRDAYEHIDERLNGV